MNIVVAGGGTGGHIYPGVAIAKALTQLNNNVKVHFVGTPQGLETKIIPRENLPLHLLPVGKLNYSGGTLKKIKTLIQMPLVFWKSYRLLRELKPQVVLGVGGYASGPVMLVASLCGYKTAIWEANAHPGLTNRILSRFVKRAYLVFEEAKTDLHCREVTVAGLPVRAAVENLTPSPRTDNEFHVLVFGGSQGARPINRLIIDSVKSKQPWLSSMRLIHQTGPYDIKEAQLEYEHSNLNVESHEYLYDMEKYLDWADLVVCRSGASTLAELAAVGKPAILIPLPHAADDHQLKNARAFEAAGAAVVLEQKNANSQTLNQRVENLRANPMELKKMSLNAKKLHKTQAAEAIAKSLLSL